MPQACDLHVACNISSQLALAALHTIWTTASRAYYCAQSLSFANLNTEQDTNEHAFGNSGVRFITIVQSISFDDNHSINSL